MNNIFGDKKIQILRHAGDLNKAELTEDGTTVYRSKTITIPAMEGQPAVEIQCAPYNNHFVFRHIYLKKGKPTRGWTLWCSCGSPAAIVDYNAYAKDASPSGQMIVCLYHAQYNRHADGTM